MDQGQLATEGSLNKTFSIFLQSQCMVNVEHTRLTKSTDVIKLGRNVLCPCSRELVILLSLQMLSVLLVQGCPLCCLLVFSFLANSMRLSWISDCYNFWVFCSRTRQQSQMLRKEKNRMPCPSFQCRKCRRSVVAKDSVPKMHALFIALCELAATGAKSAVCFVSESWTKVNWLLTEGRLNKTLSKCWPHISCSCMQL